MSISEQIVPKFQLRKPKRDECVELLKWVGFYLSSSLLPIYGSAGLLWLFTNDAFDLAEFASTGEMALLSAALVGTLATLLARGTQLKFPFHGAFLFAASLLAVVSLLIFAGSVLAENASQAAIAEGGIPYVAAKKLSVMWISVVVYFLSVGIVVFALLCDLQFENLSPRSIVSDQQDSLAKQFEETGVE